MREKGSAACPRELTDGARRVQRHPNFGVEWSVQRPGIKRLVLNGSFVTDAIEPNDVDCVLLIGTDFREDSEIARELREGLPFLDLHIVEEAEFLLLVDEIFATDRDTVPKGLVELMI